MKQILWFKRDLRVNDNAILSIAKGEVLPIFIFDTNYLKHLSIENKRISFVYFAVLRLKKELQEKGLDLAIFYGKCEEIFKNLKSKGFNIVITNSEYDNFSKERIAKIEKILPITKVQHSFILDPNSHLTKNSTPYRVFTPFYKSLSLPNSYKLFEISKNLKLSLQINYKQIPTLKEMGFIKEDLANFLYKDVNYILDEFILKIPYYEKERDYFYKNATSNLSVFLRFGIISPKEVYNKIAPIPNSQPFIRELFFREFYSYLLYHFPYSEFENFNKIDIKWSNNHEHFFKWCEGKTGVPIVDASMIHFQKTGLMHNRLRMIVSSYLTKNLLIDWRWGERYFAQKLFDYEPSSNIGSWQWVASTGSDGVPYFRLFNPYRQSEKFDKEGKFITSIFPKLLEINPKELHQENGVQNNLLMGYPSQLITIEESKKRVINIFEKGLNKKNRL